MSEMINVLLAGLRKIARILQIALRWLLIAIALMVLIFLLLRLVNRLTYDTTKAENEARILFTDYCKSICVNPNEFDGPTPIPFTDRYYPFIRSEYSFIWSEHNKPEQTIEVAIVFDDAVSILPMDDVFFNESKEFDEAHPWTSRVDCQAAKR